MTLIELVPGKIYLIHSRACCWWLTLNGWPKCFLTKIKHQLSLRQGHVIFYMLCLTKLNQPEFLSTTSSTYVKILLLFLNLYIQNTCTMCPKQTQIHLSPAKLSCLPPNHLLSSSFFSNNFHSHRYSFAYNCAF